MMKLTAMTVLMAGAALVAVSAPVQAATVLPTCAATDISSTLTRHITASTYTAGSPTTFASTSCTGFVAGNLLNNSNNAALVAKLNALVPNFATVGTFNFGDYTTISGLGGAQAIDFTTPLNGLTLIGVHYGAGNFSPSDIAGNSGQDKSDSTAFYLFDAGTNLDKFYLTFGASSSVTLFSTGVSPAVPEPASWAMMIGGFALAGGAMRRKAKASVRFA